MTPQELKFELQQQCKDLIKIRYESVNKTIANIEQALRDESKSASGDKHHIERAMLQIQREEAGKQLREIEKVMFQLDKVTISDVSETIRLGSIIETNQANFFISISVGKLEVKDTIYLGVSPVAPIGRCLLGKVKNEQFNFNGVVYKIQNFY
jgi:transcription elongation GreA/GreB family factor